jgi:hypothetical protein
VVVEEEETTEEEIGLDGEDSGEEEVLLFATGEVVEAGISMEFIFQ